MTYTEEDPEGEISKVEVTSIPAENFFPMEAAGKIAQTLSPMHMYFIALVLPPMLNDKVLSLKNFMAERYGCRVALKSPAHITLVPPFWMAEEKDADLRSAIDRLSASMSSFDINTEDFSSFPPKTIFIRLSENMQLSALKSTSDVFFRSQPAFGISPEARPFHPHITIATRDLYKKDFHEAWPLFRQKVFRESWQAEGISLLKHNKKNWDVVYTSQCKNNKTMS